MKHCELCGAEDKSMITTKPINVCGNCFMKIAARNGTNDTYSDDLTHTLSEKALRTAAELLLLGKLS